MYSRRCMCHTAPLVTRLANALSLATFDRAASEKPISDGDQARCLSRVKRVTLTIRRSLPLFPDERTFSESVGVSNVPMSDIAFT
jgi:hypothetical protein